jgi:hypothetical protein
MEDNVAQQLQARLTTLPDDVRTAVLSVEWEHKVQAIAGRHQLHIDQIGALGDVTLMAMLGMFDIVEYPNQVAVALAIAPDIAATVAKEVSDEVFMPIRESLRTLSQQKAAPAAFPAMSMSATPASSMPVATPAPAIAKPDLAAADAMLHTSMVSTPAPATPAAAPALPTTPVPDPAKPTYSADPYREPPV